MPDQSQSRTVRVADYQAGDVLRLQTPNAYAMDRAVDILRFLEGSGAAVAQSGWQRGFGLEVASGVPIQLDRVVAELSTDGEEIVVARTSGSAERFDALCSKIIEFTGAVREGAA